MIALCIAKKGHSLFQNNSSINIGQSHLIKIILVCFSKSVFQKALKGFWIFLQKCVMDCLVGKDAGLFLNGKFFVKIAEESGKRGGLSLERKNSLCAGLGGEGLET